MSSDNEYSHLASAIEDLQLLSVEQLRCFFIDADSRCLRVVAPEELARELPKTDNGVWVDIQAIHPEVLSKFLKKLSLHPLIIEDCLDPYRSSRFSSYQRSLHFEFPVFTGESVDEYLSVICVPRMLVTIRTTHISAIDRLLQDLDTHLQLNEGTNSALLYALLDRLGDCLVQAARETRGEIRRITVSLDRGADDVEPDEIVSVRRTLQDINMIAEDQLYCVRGLLSVDSYAFPISKQRDFLRDATRNYETALRVLQRYETGATELHQQYLLSLQSKTETRIRILTILSSICMPLTLIAGIYGMNFARMPELHASWGYPATLAAMFVIAVGQLLFFYRRGWLG